MGYRSSIGSLENQEEEIRLLMEWSGDGGVKCERVLDSLMPAIDPEQHVITPNSLKNQENQAPVAFLH